MSRDEMLTVEGMSLRDWFAGMALHGSMSAVTLRLRGKPEGIARLPVFSEDDDANEAADMAYHMADKMLMAREVPT